MDLSQYQGNSNASRIQKTEEVQDHKVEQIATGKKVPQSAGSKFLSNLFADDIQNIKEYILWDVLMPAFKNAISDTITNGIDMLLFGTTRSGRGSSKKVNYSGIYSGGSSSRVIRFNDKRDEEPRRKGGIYGYSYQEIVLNSRAEAEDVLWHLRKIERDYGMVSVADMYQAVGEDFEFTDNKWGWSDLDSATVQRVSDGFIIKMPRIEAL